MKNVTIRNFHNAFTSLRIGEKNIVVDPWIKDGIYNESWCISPEVDRHEMKKSLTEAHFCLITHIHEDHFDTSAL